MGAPFEWQACGEMSHAIAKSETRPPLPDDVVRTLCGLTLTLTRADFSRENRYWIRGCKRCMDTWASYQESQLARVAR